MGFKGMLTEGAETYFGLEEPALPVSLCHESELEVIAYDFKLSDDISLRFSNSRWNEYPLFADKYIDWIAALPEENRLSIFSWNFLLWVSPSHCLQYFGIYESTACLHKEESYFLYSDRYHYQTEICGSGGCSLSYVMDRRGTRYRVRG